MNKYVPKLIQQIENKKSGEIVTALDWNTLFNLLISQGDDTALNLESLYNIIDATYSNTAKIEEMIDAKVVEIGTSDMAKAEYDTNKNGIVDKAESVIDDSITTANLKNNAVTEPKLGADVKTKLNKIHSAMFKIDFSKATRHTVGSISGYVELNDTYFFDLGFTPKAVLIFGTDNISVDNGSSYVRDRTHDCLIFSYQRYYEYSSRDDEENIDYGGFASTGSPAIGLRTGGEIFSITTNGINVENYRYYHEYSDGSEETNIISLNGSWCIAIG